MHELIEFQRPSSPVAHISHKFITAVGLGTGESLYDIDPEQLLVISFRPNRQLVILHYVHV